MEDLIKQTIKSIEELELKVNELFKRLSGKEVPISFKDGAKNFDANLKLFIEATQKGNDANSILKSAKSVAVYGRVINNALRQSSTLSDDERSLLGDISDLSNSIRKTVEHRSELFEADNTGVTYSSGVRKAYEENSESQLMKNLELIKEDHEKHDQRHQKLLSENLKRIESIETKSKSLESEVAEQLQLAKTLYGDTLKELEEKKKQVNKLLGVISGGAISGNFEQSAKEEKAMADWLRYASLTCMALILIVIGYSFWETTTDDFRWENSVFRIVLAFLLSVPSAYLARESAKHREQQYTHLQTSLDLKAINPYVASLPSEQQHKIKADVAGRIFAAKDFSKVGGDPYPLNTHEIVMEILKKIDFKQKSESTKESEKG
ncbi:hypothetical protein AADZ84_16230 [Colwelliaceae bacterium MEBiC 14330]